MGTKKIKDSALLAAKLFPRRKDETEKTSRSSGVSLSQNSDVLNEAFLAWTNLYRFRKQAQEAAEFVYGVNHWNGKVRDENGRLISERQSIIKEGGTPLIDNRTGGIIRSIVGVYQQNPTEPTCTTIYPDNDRELRAEIMTAALRSLNEQNNIEELDFNNLRQMAITCLAASRSETDSRSQYTHNPQILNYNVNYNNIFFNQFEDPRTWDIRLIGEIHDMGLYDAAGKFCNGSQDRYNNIINMYHNVDKDRLVEDFGDTLTDNSYSKSLDFYMNGVDNSLCRVIEVWRKESRKKYFVHDESTGEYYTVDATPANKARLKEIESEMMEEQRKYGVKEEDMLLLDVQWGTKDVWCYYFLSPFGDVLKSGESEYWHESHPYSLRLYIFQDGIAHSFISEVMDMQRLANQMLQMIQFLAKTIAKGSLLVDEAATADGQTIDETVNEYHRHNGVVMYNSRKGGKPPMQLTGGNIGQLGLMDVFQIVLRQMEDISGVQGALQGKTPAPGTPASLYAQQAQNATTSLVEMLETFRKFREDRDTKNMQLIQQFYTEKQYIDLTGSTTRQDLIYYDPEMVRNAEFRTKITESQTTPMMRQITNNFLMQIFQPAYQAGELTLVNLVEMMDIPNKDNIIQTLKNNAAQAREQQQPLQAPPELQAQIQQNPAVQRILQQQPMNLQQ